MALCVSASALAGCLGGSGSDGVDSVFYTPPTTTPPTTTTPPNTVDTPPSDGTGSPSVYAGRTINPAWQRVGLTHEIAADGNYGQGVGVAVLDGLVKTDHPDLIGTGITTLTGGTYTGDDNHGTQVAGLIAADGSASGLVSAAPDADIYSIGVFDDNDWVGGSGYISELATLGRDRKVSVANMSYGPVGGDVFTNNSALTLISTLRDEVFFAIAAGNYSKDTDDLDYIAPDLIQNVIFVGAVDASNTLSPFSNTPGEACLGRSGCDDADKVKHRFLVAPGQSLTTTSVDSTTTTVSGTSMSAPLVSGAAALLQSKWGWLKDDPNATADILLDTATDLGAAGTDSVYGAGLLNIAAAMAPIGQTALLDRAGQASSTAVNLSTALSASAFVGTEVAVFDERGRDFQVALSSLVSGGPGSSFTAPTGAALADIIAARQVRQISLARTGSAAVDRGTLLRFGRSAERVAAVESAADTEDPWLAAHANRHSLLALALSPAKASFASGKTTASAMDLKLNKHLSFSAGAGFAPVGADDVAQNSGVNSATWTRLTYQANPNLKFSTALFDVREQGSLLGATSSGALATTGSTRTQAIEMRADWTVARDYALSLMHRRAQSRFSLVGAAGSNRVSSDSLTIAVAKASTFVAQDRIRLAFARPLAVRSGAVTLANMEVIDRDTGALGLVEREIDLATRARQTDLSLSYERPIMNGQGRAAALAFLSLNAEHVKGKTNIGVGASFSYEF